MSTPGEHRDHGTRARYVWGPDEHDQPGHGCREPLCTKANREAMAYRERMIAYDRWEPYVDAGPARDWIAVLRGYGIGWRQVAKLSGCGGTTIQAILGIGRPAVKRIRPATEAAILAIEMTPANLAPCALTDATGTHRRLQALVYNGWSIPRLGAQLGHTVKNALHHYLNNQQITAKNALAVAALYDRLWNTPPPESTHTEKIAASRARNHARRNGWAGPGAYDDDQIDNPAAEPAEGWQRPAQRPVQVLVEDFDELVHCYGLTPERAAERLGVSVRTVHRARAGLRVAAGPAA